MTNTASSPAEQKQPPPNTEENRRDLAWDFIESCDSKTLDHLLADLLCGQWEKDDVAFRDWWQSQYDPV